MNISFKSFKITVPLHVLFEKDEKGKVTNENMDAVNLGVLSNTNLLEIKNEIPEACFE